MTYNDLQHTPSYYVSGQSVRVNAEGTGLELFNVQSALDELFDTIDNQEAKYKCSFCSSYCADNLKCKSCGVTHGFMLINERPL